MYSYGYFSVVTSLLLYCCYTDIRWRLIKNYTVIALLAIILLLSVLFGYSLHYIAALVVLLVGIILFYLNLIGAGDVKLLAVLSLSVPSYYFSSFLFLVTLSGIPLIIAALVLRFHKRGLPYGVAITLGYIVCFMLIATRDSLPIF